MKKFLSLLIITATLSSTAGKAGMKPDDNKYVFMTVAIAMAIQRVNLMVTQIVVPPNLQVPQAEQQRRVALLTNIERQFGINPVSNLAPTQQRLVVHNDQPATTNRLQDILNKLGIKIVMARHGTQANLWKAANVVAGRTRWLTAAYDKPLIEVLQELMRTEGRVEVDNQLFVQIAALLLEGRGGECFVLRKGSVLDPRLLTISHRHHIIGIRHFHERVQEVLANSDPLFVIDLMKKMHLLLVDVGNGTWAAMAPNGPIYLKSLRAWKEFLALSLNMHLNKIQESGRVNEAFLAAMLLKVLFSKGAFTQQYWQVSAPVDLPAPKKGDVDVNDL